LSFTVAEKDLKEVKPMSDTQNEKPRPTTGTTEPIPIDRDPASRIVQPGETYFIVKIRSAQAAFSGRIWERVKRLIVTSQVALNHPVLGPEPIRAIQRSREVRQGRAEQLGLSPNLINLVPATMDHISISIEFILDKENRLAALGGLINDDSFLAAVSLAPGAAVVARTIAGLSQKILQTFIQPEEREPILQFSGDFNLASGELQEGHYVILGTRDERCPLPRGGRKFRVRDGDLLADGKAVTQWSYVLLEVRCLGARTRDLNEGATWAKKLRQAEAVAQRLASDPFVDDEERQRAWQECKALLKETQVLILDDTNYLRREAQDITKAAFANCYADIFGQQASRRALVALKETELDSGTLLADRAFLGIPPDEDLEATLDRYADQVAEARRLIRQEGIR
jgi:hypothetical protein